MRQIQLVAHRGYSHSYPENTILALRKAIEAGVKYIELDVQVTRDLIPILLHDEALERTTDGAGLVYEREWSEIEGVHAGERERFDKQFALEPLPKLEALTELLSQHPDVTAYVEIKDESVEVLGAELVVYKVLTVLKPVLNQAVIIGYNAALLEEVRRQGKQDIGWVLTDFSEEEHVQANQLKPNFIICNYTKIDAPLWQGPWQWFIYEVTEWSVAEKWFDRGVDFIETMQVVEMLDQQKQVTP